jgi:hypothetical protein
MVDCYRCNESNLGFGKILLLNLIISYQLYINNSKLG